MDLHPISLTLQKTSRKADEASGRSFLQATDSPQQPALAGQRSRVTAPWNPDRNPTVVAMSRVHTLCALILNQLRVEGYGDSTGPLDAARCCCSSSSWWSQLVLRRLPHTGGKQTWLLKAPRNNEMSACGTALDGTSGSSLVQTPPPVATSCCENCFTFGSQVGLTGALRKIKTENCDSQLTRGSARLSEAQRGFGTASCSDW